MNFRAEARDHAADEDLGAVLERLEIGDAVLDLALQRRLDPEQRVIGHVEAEHLLLGLQTVALVELDVGDRDALVEPGGCVGGRLVVPVAEQAHHAAVALAAAIDA